MGTSIIIMLASFAVLGVMFVLMLRSADKQLKNIKKKSKKR